MTKRGWAVLACVAWVAVACGGTQAPAESPASGSPKAAEDDGAKPKLESGPVATSGDEAPPATPVTKQELPCPGKNAKYWDSGLLRSEVLTSDCELNGQSFKAGTRLEFDDEGQLVPQE
jgi:hypothetical protein